MCLTTFMVVIIQNTQKVEVQETKWMLGKQERFTVNFIQGKNRGHKSSGLGSTVGFKKVMFCAKILQDFMLLQWILFMYILCKTTNSVTQKLQIILHKTPNKATYMQMYCIQSYVSHAVYHSCSINVGL